MTYAAAVQEMMATPGPDTRRSDLVRRSDRFLHQLEQLNLDAYGPYRPEQRVPGSRKVVPLPADLAQAINELRRQVGLPARRLRTTDVALEAVFQIQRVLFGHLDDEEDLVDES